MRYINGKTNNTQQIGVDEETDFNRKGLQAVNSKEKVFAKIVESSNKSNYFISTYKNEIYDPMGINSNREQFLETKLKRVSKDTFDFYLIYLQTNNSIYLTRCNRRFINE